MDLNTILYGQGQPAPTPPQTVLPQAVTPLEAPTQTPLAPEQVQVMQQEGISGQGTGTGFFDKLRSDPALHQAMLMMGARLMQGPKQGQNELGVLGDATAVAAQVHNMMATNERTMQTDEAQAASRINRENAGADALRGEEARRNESFPQTQAKVAEEIKQLRAQGRLNEARALQEQWKADPKRMAEERQLDLDRTRAQIGASNASAANSYAHADAAKASAARTRDETANPGKYRAGGPDTLGAVGKNLRDWEAHFVAQGMPPEEAKKEAEKAVKKAKNADAAAGFLKFATDGMYDITKPEEYAKAKKAYEQVQKDFSGEVAATAPTAGGLPPGVTEEDVQFTMKKRKMTREQVIEALGKGKK